MKNKEKLLSLFAERRNSSIEDLDKQVIFNKQIFMGAGNSLDSSKDFSGQESSVLHYLIDRALSNISGMQQNGGMGYAFDNESQKQAEKDLENIVKNIVMALTGK